MPEENKDEILTINQTAELLKVSSWTVYELVSAERQPGKIFAKKVGRSWRIMRKEVDNFLSEEHPGFDQLTLNQTNPIKKRV
jgi:excisionase family DNA binding protein